MDKSSDNKEKRKFPRVFISLPVDFLASDAPKVIPGIVINLSVGGLLIQTFKDLPIGMRVNITVLFSQDTEFVNFRATAEIIWKDVYLWEDWEGYQYGLKLIGVPNKDLLNLKRLLFNESNMKEISSDDKSDSEVKI